MSQLHKKFTDDQVIDLIGKFLKRAIPMEVENNISKELSIEKTLIEDKNVPLHSYSYSYIKDRLEKDYKQKISLPTIIDKDHS